MFHVVGIQIALLVVALIVGFVVHEVNVSKAKARLKSLEDGKLCVHCGSNNVERVAEGVRCEECGELTTNSLIDQAPVDHATLSSLMMPDDEGALDPPVRRLSQEEREREAQRKAQAKEEERRRKRQSIQDQASEWSAQVDE